MTDTPPTTTGLTPEDIAGIRLTVDEVGRHQSEPEPFLALHTEDAVIVNIAARRVLGKESLAQAMASALASPLADVITQVEIEDVRPVSAGVALVSCRKRVLDQRDDQADPLPAEAALSYVLVEEGDRWRVALAQTTPVMG